MLYLAEVNPEEGFQEQGHENTRQGRNSMYECRYYSFLSVEDHFKYIYCFSQYKSNYN